MDHGNIKIRLQGKKQCLITEWGKIGEYMKRDYNKLWSATTEKRPYVEYKAHHLIWTLLERSCVRTTNQKRSFCQANHPHKCRTER